MNKEIILKIKVNIDDFYAKDKQFLIEEEIDQINHYIEEKVVEKLIRYNWIKEFINVFPQGLPAASTNYEVISIERL